MQNSQIPQPLQPIFSEHTYTIRPMLRHEVDLAIEWAAAEGWNPGLHDAECFFTADPTGFLIGLLDNEPIATLSAVRYGTDFGFLGFYIVKPAYRGQGYGLRLWHAGLDYLQGRIIGLDGVVAQQDNYHKLGFNLAYRTTRYAGRAAEEQPDLAGIVPLATIPLAAVCAYDQPLFPADRTRFLHSWINQPHSTALGIVHDERLAGYGVLRPCRVGYKLGPLMADSPELANRLFAALCAHVPGNAPIYLDAPTVNPAAVALAHRHAMRAVFETARMYRGQFPTMPLDRVFGITSFELG